MTAVFHTWPYGRLIEIQSNLRRKKLHRTNQGSDFLRGSFSNRDNVRSPIQFRRESQPQVKGEKAGKAEKAEKGEKAGKFYRIISYSVYKFDSVVFYNVPDVHQNYRKFHHRY